MLAVFDFDHTIINGNSDVIAYNLIYPPDLIPDQKNYRSNWTEFMQKVFDTLKNINISPEQIMDAVSSMSPNEGIPKLMRTLNENNFDIIVASDSNMLFIHNWFEHNKLSEVVTHIYTNPAKIEDGFIKIKPYTHQTTCNLCQKNMCKGTIVDEYVSGATKKYSKILYFGDGKNDLCPVLKLTQSDVAFPRSGYVLENLLKSHTIQATVVTWCTGNDIYEYLKSSKLI